MDEGNGVRGVTSRDSSSSAFEPLTAEMASAIGPEGRRVQVPMPVAEACSSRSGTRPAHSARNEVYLLEKSSVGARFLNFRTLAFPLSILFCELRETVVIGRVSTPRVPSERATRSFMLRTPHFRSSASL